MDFDNGINTMAKLWQLTNIYLYHNFTKSQIPVKFQDWTSPWWVTCLKRCKTIQVFQEIIWCVIWTFNCWRIRYSKCVATILTHVTFFQSEVCFPSINSLFADQSIYQSINRTLLVQQFSCIKVTHSASHNENNKNNPLHHSFFLSSLCDFSVILQIK